MVKGGERVDRGLPHGSAGTESTCDARDTGYSPKGSQESVTTERLGTSAGWAGSWERLEHIHKGDKRW